MYKSKLTALLAACIVCMMTACQSSKHLPSSEQAIIVPGSARAHMLCLSAEDIFYLNQESPNILHKIDRGDCLSVDDILVMHEVGVSADSMIQILVYTKTKFELSTSDVIRLQMEGVSFKVINHMIHS